MIWITVIVSCLHLVEVLGSDGSLHVGFVRAHLCHFQERASFNLVRAAPVLGRVDPLSCSRACRRDPACAGFSFAINKTTENFSDPEVCYVHQEYKSYETCTSDEAESNHAYYLMYGVCHNGGSWNAEAQRCVCPQDSMLVGRLCSSHPKSCKDLALAGYVSFSSDLYVKPGPKSDGVTIWCTIRQDGIARTTIANNKRTSETFQRNMDDYKRGFGLMDRPPYWLGLEHVRDLIMATPTPSNLAVVAVYGGQEGNVGEMRALDVHLSSSRDGFTLTFKSTEQTGKFVGHANFCFRDASGRGFTSPDNDRDGDEGRNCAVVNQFSWWFDGCQSPCNPLGALYTFSHNMRTAREPYSPTRVRLGDVELPELSFYLNQVFLELQQ